MLTRVVIKLLSLLLTFILPVVVGQCSLNIAIGLPNPEPIFIRNNNLWYPNGPALTWTAGESTTIGCSGTGNKISINSQVTSTIKCDSNMNFFLGTTSYYAKNNFACSKTIYADVQNTGTSCGGGLGVLFKIGFNFGTYFITYIQSCYNVNKASALYTTHLLPKIINSAVSDSSRPDFSPTGTPSTVTVENAYLTTSQKSRFTALFNSISTADKYLSTSSSLQRGHLSPKADGIFRTTQFATFFYINAAPQWQQINTANWVRVENAARSKANQLQQDLVIYTGTYGILSLENVPITLENGKIEVPRFFWKIVKNVATNSAIAFVTLNNPFATSLGAGDSICPDISSTTGWAVTEYKIFNKGYTVVCNVNSLAVSFIPAEAKAPNVLLN